MRTQLLGSLESPPAQKSKGVEAKALDPRKRIYREIGPDGTVLYTNEPTGSVREQKAPEPLKARPMVEVLGSMLEEANMQAVNAERLAREAGSRSPAEMTLIGTHGMDLGQATKQAQAKYREMAKRDKQEAKKQTEKAQILKEGLASLRQNKPVEDSRFKDVIDEEFIRVESRLLDLMDAAQKNPANRQLQAEARQLTETKMTLADILKRL